MPYPYTTVTRSNFFTSLLDALFREPEMCITLTAMWTAPGGPGPYSGVLGRFSSVAAHVCGATRPYAGPCP